MKYILPLFALFILFIYSCRPTDDFNTDPSVKLEFSLDTLHFDTVFTEIGSATRILKVYNRNKKAIKISKISIKNHPNSFFRINVDGIAGNVATDIEIAGNDSLYIFGEVTVDPDQPLSLSPFVIEDYLVFEINGNTQEVLMEAWGQNATYFPDRFSKGGFATLKCDGGTFTITNEKPWVFYGTTVFDGCNVIVEEGARIHVHGGIVPEFDQDSMKFFRNDGRIVFVSGSSLTVNGTQENPVLISGDRLEESFDNVSGQWFGILLIRGSKNHHIQHMELKNAIVGIYADSTDLNIESSKIFNTANSGLYAIKSKVDATNCLFYNNAKSAVNIFQGGDYNFTYCTLASYGVESPALSMTNILPLGEFPNPYDPCLEYRLNAHFKNSIIFGSKKDEISMFDGDGCDEGLPSPIIYTFENCIVRVDELVNNPDDTRFSDFFQFCDPCQNADNNDAVFLNPNEDDYHLDTLSIAEMKAETVSVTVDLDGNMRGENGEAPDEGCYEYQY
ncbi:MAG TPA: hypothetical protein ENJ53_04735 [Phaeodactylibacter sp.]|nr:hypothetical protein [Phaeodactylibacter sp.]